MDNLFFLSVSILGMFQILKYGAILNNPRKFLIEKVPKLKELFSCGMCMGFWLGLFVSLFVGKIFLLPFYGSAICWMYDYAIQYIQKVLYPDE